METRSNRYLVGGVIAAMLAALFAFVVWKSPAAPADSRLYEIPFQRSVAGLQQPSPVTFQGIAVGRVTSIFFDRQNPEIIRVRILITNPDTPILQGTTARLRRDLFGAATIGLDSGPAGSPPLVASRAGEIPIIPTKGGGGLMGDPVGVLKSVSITTEKLNRMLDPAGQASISDAIRRLEARSGALAENAPKLAGTLANARTSIRGGAETARAIGAQADAVDRQLRQSKAKVAEYHQTLASAREGMKKIDDRVAAARPMIQNLSNGELQTQVRELRGATSEIKEKVQTIDSRGVGALLSKPALPEYEEKN
jgi:phospholipid/cholesterol/gamma-HCH transport system substrate-binding protein